MTVTVTEQGLLVDGRLVPVYAGAVQYWRLERDAWERVLDAVVELGFEVIETYVPWGIHETAPGAFDWGDVEPRKGLDSFLDLCHERGLYVLARPGPLIDAELTDFGFPERVLLDPRVQARTAVGTPHFSLARGFQPPHQFPVPSYASEAFYGEIAGWFDAVCPVLARHLAPTGPIIAVQSDNETSYVFWDEPYATDYADDSLALYRRFLVARHGSVEAIAAAHGQAYASLESVEPPRDCRIVVRGDIPRHLDWVAYKEFQVRWAVTRIARMLRERGLVEVVIFHDVSDEWRTPIDVARLEADPEIDWVGMNQYRTPDQYREIVTQARFLSAATRLPFVPEFGAGRWSHHPVIPSPGEEEFTALSAIMHGIRAFSLYMLVERERWTASPIRRDGTLRPEFAALWRDVAAFLREHELWRFERRPDVLAMLNYDVCRLSAALTTLHDAHVDLLGLPAALRAVDADLGLGWDLMREADVGDPASWLGAVLAELGRRRVDHDLGDTHLGRDRLDRYRVIVLQSLGFMDADDQARLLGWIEEGGHLLVGPAIPTMDPALLPCRVLAHRLDGPGTSAVGSGRITWAQDPIAVAGMAATSTPGDVDRQPVTCDEPLLDLVLHRDGPRGMLFAANPTPAALRATVTVRDASRLRPAWPPGGRTTAAAPWTVDVPARAVRAWRVEP